MDPLSLLRELSVGEFSGHNFLDLKWDSIGKCQVQFEIPSRSPTDAIFFRSEDGTKHFYGNDSSLVAWLVKKVKNETTEKQATIFTTEKLESIVLDQFEGFKRRFQFEYYNLPKENSFSSKDKELKFRFLSPDRKGDQELLESWYKDYNKEMESTWIIPKLSLENKERFLVLENAEGKILGFAALTLESPDRLWFGRLYIPTAFRSQSFAKLLVSELIEIARRRGKDLSLLVHEDNLKAKTLYEGFGFLKMDKIVILEAES
ncbi:MAG: GNAT family N-acetyltransferase [Bdellovibrionales bacterium]